MTEIIDGDAVAADIRTALSECITTVEAAGVTPGLATVLMSDDPASETYVSMKQQDCEEVGINGIHVELQTDAPAEGLYETIASLNTDEDVHGVLVQMPLVKQVDTRRVLRSVDPVKDVDGFHPENMGRLVAGHDRYRPCTPHGIQKLLEAYDIETEGADVVIVGRSNIVGKPLANLFIQKTEDGNATVTVCHSRTSNLAEKTRAADILVAAAGNPGFITDDMVSENTVVIDVGVNRVDAETEKGYELVGDVDYDAVKDVTRAITPVPGGVGPMTRAMLLYNTVKATSIQEDITVDLP